MQTSYKHHRPGEDHATRPAVPQSPGPPSADAAPNIQIMPGRQAGFGTGRQAGLGSGRWAGLGLDVRRGLASVLRQDAAGFGFGTETGVWFGSGT